MKTNFKLNNRVKGYLEKAINKSIATRGTEVVTTEYLFLEIMLDEDNELGKFIERQGMPKDIFLEDLQNTEILSEEEKENFYIFDDTKQGEYSSEVTDVLQYAEELAKKKGLEEVDENCLNIAIVNCYNSMWGIIGDYEPEVLDEIKENFSEERYFAGKIKKTHRVSDDEILDNTVKIIFTGTESDTEGMTLPMLDNLSDKFNEKDPRVILGRDKEIDKAFVILQKMTTRNLILLGEAGVGKTAIVEGIVERIAKGNCPDEFKNKRVLELNINKLIENTKYVGQREEKFNRLREFLLLNQDVILFIDEIHIVIGAGRSEGNSYDLSNALKPILTGTNVRVIGATTAEEYEKYISKDPAFKRRFTVIEVAEPKEEKLYSMLKGQVGKLKKHHNVIVSKEIFDYVVEQAKKHNPEVANPARTMELLDISMAIAKNKGEEKLDEEAVLEACDNGYTYKKAIFTPLNDKFQKKGPKIILERKDEIEKVFITFQKMTTRNVILIGEPGVGKTAIAEGLAESIVKGKCPEEFKDNIVLSLDLNGLIKDTKYVGEKEKRFYELKLYLEKHENVILFIDEIHTIVGAGKSENDSFDLANALKPILTNGTTKIIGATTNAEYKKYFAKDGALKRRFEVIEVKEPKIKKLYKMLKGRICQLEQKHGVKVTKEAFDKVVAEASGYDFNVANPSRTVDLLDTAMVISKNHGEEILSTRSILEVHKSNIKEFKKINKRDLKSTAYHEAGHYILWRAANNKFTNVTLLSIIPSGDYVGVTCYEEKEGCTNKDRGEYINKIAELLAGGIASELKGYKRDSGPSNDRERATMIARNMIINFGMQLEESSLGTKNSFLENGEMNFEFLSDKQKEDLAKQTDAILKEAYEKANRILKRKDKQLEIIAQALMKQGSLTREQLDLLYKGKIKVEDLPDPEWKLIK